MLAAGAVVLLVAGCGSGPAVPARHMSGIAERPCTGQVVAEPPDLARGTRFIPGSSVLASDVGRSCTAAAVAASRRWLRDGAVPGGSAADRELATRALLDLRLSVQPDGAVVAGYYANWWYTWPRDSSWVVAALSYTGHGDEALRALRFLQRMQPAGGVWAARYHPDGSGPVSDGRAVQLDSDGWVPWAVWCWASTVRVVPGAAGWQELTGLWPMVVGAADAAAGSLTAGGLPEPAHDYWEKSQADVTLGTAAPLLAGLRAAADLAGKLAAGSARAGAALGTGAAGPAAAGLGAERARWQAAAGRLSAAITARFGATGYLRTPSAGSGQDAAVTFLGPPFCDPGRAVIRAAGSAERALALPDGGLRPGTAWSGAAGVAWTPETAMFALFDAGTGQTADAERLLSWLRGHETGLGELPEQVSPSGQPVSVAPLAWTDAIVLLTLVAEDHPLGGPGGPGGWCH